MPQQNGVRVRFRHDGTMERTINMLDPNGNSWDIDDVLCRYVIAGSLFAILNGCWIFAPDVGGRFGWSTNWVLAELVWTIRGMIYLFGGFVTAIGLRDCFPWRKSFRKHWAMPIVGGSIVLLNAFFGLCVDAYANRAYARGHWDGIHRREPCDYRDTDIPIAIELTYRDKKGFFGRHSK